MADDVSALQAQISSIDSQIPTLDAKIGSLQTAASGLETQITKDEATGKLDKVTGLELNMAADNSQASSLLDQRQSDWTQRSSDYSQIKTDESNAAKAEAIQKLSSGGIGGDLDKLVKPLSAPLHSVENVVGSAAKSAIDTAGTVGKDSINLPSNLAGDAVSLAGDTLNSNTIIKAGKDIKSVGDLPGNLIDDASHVTGTVTDDAVHHPLTTLTVAGTAVATGLAAIPSGGSDIPAGAAAISGELGTEGVFDVATAGAASTDGATDAAGSITKVTEDNGQVWAKTQAGKWYEASSDGGTYKPVEADDVPTNVKKAVGDTGISSTTANDATGGMRIIEDNGQEWTKGPSGTYRKVLADGKYESVPTDEVPYNVREATGDTDIASVKPNDTTGGSEITEKDGQVWRKSPSGAYQKEVSPGVYETTPADDVPKSVKEAGGDTGIKSVSGGSKASGAASDVSTADNSSTLASASTSGKISIEYDNGRGGTSTIEGTIKDGVVTLKGNGGDMVGTIGKDGTLDFTKGREFAINNMFSGSKVTISDESGSVVEGDVVGNGKVNITGGSGPSASSNGDLTEELAKNGKLDIKDTIKSHPKLAGLTAAGVGVGVLASTSGNEATKINDDSNKSKGAAAGSGNTDQFLSSIKSGSDKEIELKGPSGESINGKINAAGNVTVDTPSGEKVVATVKSGKLDYTQTGKDILGTGFSSDSTLSLASQKSTTNDSSNAQKRGGGSHTLHSNLGVNGSTDTTSGGTQTGGGLNSDDKKTQKSDLAANGTKDLTGELSSSLFSATKIVSADVTKAAEELKPKESAVASDGSTLHKAENHLSTLEGEVGVATKSNAGGSSLVSSLDTQITEAKKTVTTDDDTYKTAQARASAVAGGNIKGYDVGATYQADEKKITELKAQETKDLKGTDVTDDNTVPLANQISKEEASAKTALSAYETDKTANALSTIKADDSKGPSVASDITDKSVSVEDLYKSSGMTKKDFFAANPALSIHYNESTGDITGSVGDKTIVYVDQTKNDAFLKDLSGSVKADTLSSSSGGSSTTPLGSNTGSITTSSSTTSSSNPQQQQLQAAISKDSAEETAYASDMAADHTAAETAGGNKVGAMNKLKRDTASGDGKLILEEDQEQVTKWTNEQAKDNAQATTDTNNYKNAVQAYNTDETALNPGTASTQAGGSPADGSSSTDTTTATTPPGSNTGSAAASGGSTSSAAQQQLQSDEALVNQYTAAVQTDRTNQANDNNAAATDHADAKTDGGNKVGATNRLVGDEATGESKKILAADSAEVTKWTNAQAQENAKAAQDTASAAAAGQQLQNDSSSLDAATAAVKQDEANIANPGTASTQAGGSPADGSSSTDTTTATTPPGSNDPTAGTNPTDSNTGGNGTASSSDPSSGGSTNEVIVNLQNQISQDQSSVATLQNQVSQYNSAAQTDQANISQDSAAASAAYASEQSYNNAVATDHADAKTDGGNKVGATNRLVGDEATGESKKILAADSAEVTKWTNAQAQENAKAAQDTASAAAAANQYNIAESNLSAATAAFTSDNNNSAAATSQLNAANQTLASDQASLQQQESAFLSSSNYSNMQTNLPTSGSANVPTTGGQTSPPPPDVTTAVVPAAKQ